MDEQEEIKVGAEISARNRARIQAIHDAIAEMGATCRVAEPPAEDAAPDAEKTVVSFGGEVKALEGGRVGGYLVRYSSAADPDLTGDFFTAKTDFDIDLPGRATVYYNHGLDATLKRRKLGKAELRGDEVGIWAEMQLEARDAYEAYLLELAQAGKLGWSSGTAAHLVEREPEGKAQRITRWPLGLDASLTPTPAEPRNVVVPLKSLIPTPTQAEAAETAPVVEVAEKSPLPEPIKSEVAKMDADPKVETGELVELKAKIAELESTIKNAPAIKAPVVLKTGLGDTETKAFCHFIRTGDRGAMGYKASNNTDMNIGTAADGGDAVPTGHYAGIIAKRDESALRTKLGCRNIPGVGTDVIVPVDNEDDGEFVSTAEATTFDRDAPAISHQHFSLVKYTKKVQLSYELLNDTDANLMAFLDDFVGRGWAKTTNANLITAAGTGGTSNVTFAHNHTIVAGELETIPWQHDTAYYLDDSPSIAWITNPATWAVIASIEGNPYLYQATPQGGGGVRPSLMNWPVYMSTKVTAIASSAKSIYFGNWNFMGYREGPGMTFLRDPYSSANTGQVNLYYWFREVYAVLNSEAIAYGTHGTAAG